MRILLIVALAALTLGTSACVVTTNDPSWHNSPPRWEDRFTRGQPNP